MLIFSLILLLVIIFVVLVNFLRNTLNRSVISATSHLEKLSDEYAKKDEEIKKLYEDAQQKTKEILENARKDGEKEKGEVVKQAQEEKEKVLQNAHREADEIMQQAERSRQALIAEINQKIDDKSLQQAAELLSGALPENVREEIHHRWLNDLMASSFEQLDRLHIPEGTAEARVVTAFALSPQQHKALGAKIQEKMGRAVNLQEEVDPRIIAGLVVYMGSLVFDGSLRSKIQEAASAGQSGG
jgi:F-type H+-transporting ATPase subunit b